MAGDIEDEKKWVECLRDNARAAHRPDPPEYAKAGRRSIELADWPRSHQVPAAAIRAVLLDESLKPDPQGLQIHGVFVTGTLNLDQAAIPCRLEISQSEFENAPSFRGSVIAELDLTGCSVPGIFLENSKFSYGLSLANIQATGKIDATGAEVGGDLQLQYASLKNPDGDALILKNTTITGDVILDSLSATGTIDANGSRVGAQLIFRDATLVNPGGSALLLVNASVGGGAYLGNLNCTGTFNANGVQIGGQLDLHDANLDNSGGHALNIQNATIAGGAFLSNAHIVGDVHAPSAHIDGGLDMQAATLDNPGHDALNLIRATINGNVFLTQLHTSGTVSADGAKIVGNLVLELARLTNFLDDAQVFPGDTLRIEGAHITGTAYMAQLEATGRIYAPNVRIDGHLFLPTAKLKGSVVLILRNAMIAGDADLTLLRADGLIDASQVHIGGHLNLSSVTLARGEFGFSALSLHTATVGRLVLIDASGLHGPVDLSYSTIRVLEVDVVEFEEDAPFLPGSGAHTLPALSSAQGLSLGSVQGFLRTDRKAARRWLETIPMQTPSRTKKEFASQPWKELARVFEQSGQAEDARWLRHKAAKYTTEAATGWARTLRYPYSWLVGYGYYPLRVFPWLAALWIITSALAWSHASDFTPTNREASTITVRIDDSPPQSIRVTGATETLPDGYPRFSPPLFAVDTAIPAASTGQSSAWLLADNLWLSTVFAIVKGFAWILTALLIAGITGILRKD